MANLNRVFLIGNLTRDPELRYVPSGTAVCNFGLAVNSVYNTQQGEKKEVVCFVRIVAWGRTAELCGEYLSKGSPIFIEGRLQYRSWDSANGEKRSTLEVRADRIQFLRSSSAGQPRKAGSDEGSQPEVPEEISLDEGFSKEEPVKSEKADKDEVPF